MAYDHRDKATSLYKNIQIWRSKDKELQHTPNNNDQPLTLEQQVDELRKILRQRDAIIAEQSDIVAKLANDLSELSTLTERLRRRSQWLMRALYLALFIWAIRMIFP